MKHKFYNFFNKTIASARAIALGTILLTGAAGTVKAQNNLNMRYYDLGNTIPSLGGTGGGAGLDVTALDGIFGTVTVNGVVRTEDFYNSDRSVANLPTTVSGYTGIQLVYVKNIVGFVNNISQAQADALIAYVKQGGILVGNMEGITVNTINKDFNKYMGEALLTQTGVSISATPGGNSTIPATAVAYHNNGGVLNLNNNAASVPTTQSASTFTGIPSESIVFTVAKPTSTAQCGSAALDFIAPSYPGDKDAISKGINGFAYLSGEFRGALGIAVPATNSGDRNNSQANINLAQMIYDFLYTPSAMKTRREWSGTPSSPSTNINQYCPVSSYAVECAAGSTAPSVNSNITNACPATTVNLNNAHTGVAPASTTIQWFTDNAHTNAVATPTAAGAGTYYAFYYDNTNNCYSPASSAVTATITQCCAANAGTIIRQ